MLPSRPGALAAALFAILCWTPIGWGQDAASDDALDRLLKQAEGAGDSTAPDSRPSGEIAPKDQDLDNLLEKLGETKDAPTARGRATAKPEDQPAPPPPNPDGPKALTGKDKDLDEHIESLIRRKKKPPQDGGEGQPQGEGPLDETIKKMREVEQRLGKPDTGEETRRKEEEIVKSLDSVLQRLRAMQGQGQGKTIRTVRVNAPQPGNQPGQNNPGAQPGSAPRQRAERPTDQHSLANAKDEWGHLPPDLKTEMDNVSQEKPLPRKQELINRYYLSVAKKSLSREE
ncbi:MAG TPA: hypothetical protein VF590_15885 [Isosphaeraceae bacterium]|jgi:hypothetical protein